MKKLLMILLCVCHCNAQEIITVSKDTVIVLFPLTALSPNNKTIIEGYEPMAYIKKDSSISSVYKWYVSERPKTKEEAYKIIKELIKPSHAEKNPEEEIAWIKTYIEPRAESIRKKKNKR